MFLVVILFHSVPGEAKNGDGFSKLLHAIVDDFMELYEQGPSILRGIGPRWQNSETCNRTFWKMAGLRQTPPCAIFAKLVW